MNVLSEQMAVTLSEAIKARRTAVAIFSDKNPSGFRIRRLDRIGAKSLFLEDFVMVADKHIKPDELMTEWNYKVAKIEANA